MKLGILCTMINGFGRRGFYNTQEIGLGRALVRKGHSVTIYKCLKKTEDQKMEKIRIEKGLTVIYLPIRGVGAHGYLHTAVLRKDLDGLLCFSDNQVFLPHIYRFCRKNKICFVPYVGTTYSLHSGIHAKVMDAWFAAGTCRIFRKTHVIAKTDGAKKELKALGVKSVRIAPVGLDTEVLKKDWKSYDREQIRREFGFHADELVLCNVARLEAEKRPFDLLEIFMRIRKKKNFRLLFVGEGPLREELEKKIAEYKAGEYVTLFERIPYDEMWKVYVAADYFVNLNKGEIFGMAVMESVYYETPVAAFQAPGPSVTLKEMPGHWLCTDDRQIEARLTGDYPSGEALAESSEKMIQTFSWRRCADAFEETVCQYLAHEGL